MPMGLSEEKTRTSQKEESPESQEEIVSKVYDNLQCQKFYKGWPKLNDWIWEFRGQ